ncbi:hypothetical protein NC652_016769 [Populus alba x Populus x berolinensis]|nr:hypothetical protein NC652_016769 [Populus alba x Populus x berolinensis]
MNTLYCAFKYKLTHKGTNQVKESKIDMLVHQNMNYLKFFLMNPFTNMFTRMTIIRNSLHVLGKIIRSLPKT